MNLSPLPRRASSPPSPARPPVDWWEAGGQRYASTSELVSTFHPGPEGANVEYHWRDRPVMSSAELVGAAGVGLATGAGLGAVAGGVGAAAVNVLAFLMALDGVRNPFGLSNFIPVSGAALGGAVLGGLGMAYTGARGAQAAFEKGTVVPGVALEKPDAHLHFYVNGQVQKDVDLNDYAQAQPGGSQSLVEF